MVFKKRYHMSYCQAFLSDTLGSDTTEAALGNRKETCQSSVCTRTPHVLPEGLQEMAEEVVIVSYIHRVNYFNPALIGPDRCWSINYILDKSASLQKVCQSRLGRGAKKLGNCDSFTYDETCRSQRIQHLTDTSMEGTGL